MDFHVPGVILAVQDKPKYKEVLMRLMEEKLATIRRAGLFLSLAILGVGMAACGPRRLNVMATPDQKLMAIGYSADRSDSIFRANNDAQMYCERRRQTVSFVKQDTIYQGRYAENLTAGARTQLRASSSISPLR